MKVKLTAQHCESSAFYGKVVEVDNVQSLEKKLNSFDSEVPFGKYTIECESVSGFSMDAHILDNYVKEIEKKRPQALDEW